jgi:hypothetical protein
MSDDTYTQTARYLDLLAASLNVAYRDPFASLSSTVLEIATATGTDRLRFTGGVQFDMHGQRYASIRYTRGDSARHVGYYTFWVQVDVYQDSASVQDCRYTATFVEPSTLGVGLTFTDAAELFCTAIADYEQAAR